MGNGLAISDLGLRGVIVETVEPAYSMATARHAELQAFLDQHSNLSTGAQVLLTAIAEGVALHLATLKAMAAVGNATLYRCGNAYEVELQMGGDWLDRRQLPASLVAAIRKNRGCVVTTREWADADAAIRKLPGYMEVESALDSAIADAQAWWFRQLPGPLFAHLTRLRPFQVLDRAARARMATRRPQRSLAPKMQPVAVLLRQAYETCFVQTTDMAVVGSLVRDFGRVARQKGSKPAGRDDLMELVQLALPVALRAGRAQVLVVGGIASVLTNNGVRGKPLAPISIYEYCRQHIIGLTADLAQAGIESRSGAQWLSTYRSMLLQVLPSQQGKLASFLEAFHEFLSLVGMERLPASIQGHRLSPPPSAAIVTEHEVKLALAYIREHAESKEVAVQANIALLLGFEIELRTYELWCIRMVDVQLEQPPYLVVYPRIRDGAGKSPSLRRQVDLLNRLLVNLLVAFKHKRRTVDHAVGDEDLFFGEPGAPDQRHAQEMTMRLVNASLAWATGNRQASFYDLRHSTFSRKAKSILMAS